TFSLKFFNKKKSLKLINNSEKVIVISEFISQHIKNEVDINKVEIIYNGIKIPSKKEINKVSINGLLFVGAINYDKGQLVALQAMNYLLKKNGTVLPITFLGKVTNFHYMKRIEKYIDQNELNPYVTFKGYKQDISRYRTPDKIVLICSEQEAFGRVTIEAMANQEIVIGNNAGATPEIIIDGKYGYLYDGGHIDLAEKIDMVTKNKINDKMINESYEYVEKHFSIKKTANMIERLFENITRIKR
ncbi:glycosyltransferase family 4 protein, partial [Enterococcus faecium]